MRESDHQFQKLIQQLSEVSGLKLPIRLERFFPGGRMIGGKYSIETNTITIYIEVVRKQCVLLFGSDERVLDYFAVIVAHELGHAADPFLHDLAKRRKTASTLIQKKEITLSIEVNAWNYARKLVPHLSSVMDIVMERSLELHKSIQVK
ncbi:hypothetical protein ABFG93_18520 [Pseudalkalibacillus hwajinpoensis]|uniref:hypothetical protein n=1 Tax=Guptibacillus hwajinpoensis TaxID=208199 RepID=UPI00325B8AE0